LKNLGADISSHGSGGSVLSNLSKGGFESLQIMKPPTRLIKKYAKIVEPLFGKIRAVALESESISVARDTLLPKLLSGDLRVGDVAA
jgi:type I restriction enzyme S subunit